MNKKKNRIRKLVWIQFQEEIDNSIVCLYLGAISNYKFISRLIIPLIDNSDSATQLLPDCINGYNSRDMDIFIFFSI